MLSVVCTVIALVLFVLAALAVALPFDALFVGLAFFAAGHLPLDSYLNRK